MKKQMKSEVSNEQAATPKRMKREHLFFLYVHGKGFIHLDKEVGAMPNFTEGELLSFTSRASANYAVEFFKKLNVAEEIKLFTEAM